MVLTAHDLVWLAISAHSTAPLYLCRLCSGEFQRPEEVPEALRWLAKLLLPHTGGQFEPSSPPALLSELTDEILVVASDAVASVTADAQPPLSGKAKFRLLAWLVADARGATVPLEKALAETVGKRLDRQAQKVRGDLAAAVALAEQARADARAAAAEDAKLAARLAADLAAIDGDEQAAIDAPKSEVYVGFHELDSLLPPPQDPYCDTTPPVAVRYPWLVDKEICESRYVPFERQCAPIPPDLANALGREATQLLWERSHRRLPMDDNEWWCLMLPGFVKHLVHEVSVRDAACDAKEEVIAELEHKLLNFKLMEDAVYFHKDGTVFIRNGLQEILQEQHEEELEKLRGELQQAKAREEALLKAFAMMGVHETALGPLGRASTAPLSTAQANQIEIYGRYGRAVST